MPCTSQQPSPHKPVGRCLLQNTTHKSSTSNYTQTSRPKSRRLRITSTNRKLTSMWGGPGRWGNHKMYDVIWNRQSRKQSWDNLGNWVINGLSRYQLLAMLASSLQNCGNQVRDFRDTSSPQANETNAQLNATRTLQSAHAKPD